MNANQSGSLLQQSRATDDASKTGFCRQAIGDSVKRWFVLIVNVAAVTTSVLTIYSCNFFTYHERDVFDDALYASTAELSYGPFEYLPKAGVGLFAYYMGDAYGQSVMVNDRQCFYYCDEYTDYQWLSSNTKDTGSGNIDIWLMARYCSILAPIAGMLALIQSVLEIDWRFRMMQCGNETFLKSQFLLIATFLQAGTFLVLYAPPIMYSTSAEDQKRHFCFSATSNVQCKMDTGSIYSLVSVLLYLTIACVSYYRPYPTTYGCNLHNSCGTKREKSIDETDDSSDGSMGHSITDDIKGGIEKHISFDFSDDDSGNGLFNLRWLHVQYIGRDAQEGQDIEPEVSGSSEEV